MGKQTVILIFTLFLTLFSCKEKQGKLSSVPLNEIVTEIANCNVLMGSAVGIAAQRPEQWDRYDVLRSKATDVELLALTNDTNSVVRCYAFQALVERNSTDLFPVVLRHLSDTATLHTLHGCIGGNQKTGDYFLEAVTEENGNHNFYRLNDKQRITIDSLILFGVGNKLEARDKLLSNLPPLEQYYSRIRQIAVDENNNIAVVTLAKYKKEQDKALIKKLLTDAKSQSYGFAAVVNFPDRSFYHTLEQTLKHEVAKTNTNHSERLKLLYQAIVQYKDQLSRQLFESILQEAKGMQRIYHADYLYQALKFYPSPIYDGLLKPIYSADSTKKSGT